MDVYGPLIRQVAFPLMRRIKHNQIQANTEELRRTERWEPASLRQFQLDKLARLLKHSLLHVPAYRTYQHLLPLVDQDPAAAMEQLPVLTKSVFRSNRDAHLADNADKKSLILNLTGGSTGEPVTFYMDRFAVEYSEAARWRGLSWWGIRIGDPVLMVWGSPIELNQYARLMFRIKERVLKNRVLIPAFSLNKERIGDYISVYERFRPMYIYGWPTSLELFAQLIQKTGMILRWHPRAILATAEVLHTHQRELLKQIFGCPVINEYGAREGGILAYECPRGKMHVTVENSWIEILDRDTLLPAKPGQSGLVVVTDLNNFVMPRLRYQLGDVASWAEADCCCGLGLPMLSSIDGREDDVFVALDGTYVNGQYFTNVARMQQTIFQFQIIQTARDGVTVRFLEHPGLDEREVRTFVHAVTDKLGEVQVTVERVPEIPPAPSGKKRVAIRTFPLT